MKIYSLAPAILAALLASALPIRAADPAPQTVTAVADVGIRNDISVSLGQNYLQIGQTKNAGVLLRGLFSFTLPEIDVPEGMAINVTSASLSLYYIKHDSNTDSAPTGTTYTFDIHALTTPFAFGTPPANGDVTWTKASPSTNWETQGGDIGPVLASRDFIIGTTASGASYSWESATLASVVSAAFGTGAGSVNLLIKLNDENADAYRRILQFASMEAAAAQRPQLVFTYELVPAPPVPEPAACAAIAGALVALAALAIRRHRR
ncbi:MAG: DNRLRE domain-containing protein [Opitutaceae bacterium]|jgi:hypothetical protein|nr:DNRLRE domain-containing protein [Opitutaceae bacterium]